MAVIPDRCPFTYGDRVVRHAWRDTPGRTTRLEGTVVGCLGATILSIRTDDGHRFPEQWGCLVPEEHDVEQATDGYRCTCCTPPPDWVHPRWRGTRGEQLNLFGAVT